MSSDSGYEFSRCKKYGTTLYSCTCPGYGFRRTCRHVDFLHNRMVENEGEKPVVTSGMNAVEFVEKWGEDRLQKLKLVGDVFEKQGCLYKRCSLRVL